jgi:hypothetical protein
MLGSMAGQIRCDDTKILCLPKCKLFISTQGLLDEYYSQMKNRCKFDCVFDVVKNTELFDLTSNIEKYQIKFRWAVISYIVLFVARLHPCYITERLRRLYSYGSVIFLPGD